MSSRSNFESLQLSEVATPRLLTEHEARWNKHPWNLEAEEDELDFLHRKLDTEARAEYRADHKAKVRKDLRKRIGWNYNILTKQMQQSDMLCSLLFVMF